MSISGPGDVTLKIAIPYGTILRILRALDHTDEQQRALAEELYDALPDVLLARVEVAKLDAGDGR